MTNMMRVSFLSFTLLGGLCSQAQQTVATKANVAVPPLVNFSGILTDAGGQPLTGVAGVTFSLYQDQQGGAPLWMETQNVEPDSRGRYQVMLGSTTTQGLPAQIFVSGEAHWLGVQAQGQPEQPRVLLVSAPYALKAGDAETVGGLPPSAFVLAAPSTASPARPLTASPESTASPADAPAVTGSGTADYIPLWSTARKLGSSVLFQSGTGATAEVGINTTTPASTLDVKGTVTATSFSGAGAVMTGTNVDGVLQVTNTNTSGFGPAIFGTTSSSGAYGVTGVVSATTGTTSGVRGETNSTSGYGVLGTSPDVGVYGNATGQSVTGGTYGILSGVWGDTGTSGEYGVLGTADDAAAGSFINNSSSGYAALTAQNLSTTGGNNVFITYGVGNNGCEIGNLGNLSCSGTITAHVSGAGPRQVSVYAMQSAENWFEDAGSGQLTNGSASISLDPAFAQTVNTGVEYHVFLTPNGDCKGLYVSQKSANSFEVHELGGGASSIAFDYRIMAKRAGYENVRLADVTEKYQKMEKQHQMLHERMAQRRAERSSAGPIPAAAARPQ